MHKTVTYWAPRIVDYLPEGIRRSANLVDLPTALIQCHLPDSLERLKAARERLAFDEIFFLQLGVLRQKKNWQSAEAEKYEVTDAWLARQVAELPFQLTHAQEHAVSDIRQDLSSGKPMNRLLQGDVGSGKTAVAALACLMVASAGAQAAIMAPTGVLAEQHFRNLSRLLGPTESEAPDRLQPGQVRLLVGDTPGSEREEILQGLADGTVKLLIGTHALLESPVVFNHLQLVVVDEQHRFGVEQRAILRKKGENPHLLVMTATPIPRSLSLTVYGDLDLTVMDEIPSGRQVVDTHVLHPKERERAYILIRSQIEKGYQAFIIYPYVEQGDNDEIRAAVEEHARLQKEIFSNYRVGLMHGRLLPKLKDEVMSQFRDKAYDILVSTAVIEVGVDIPNATVMLIEGANRFGLAQLHQFRGRVGRGPAKSFCLLIPETDDAVENERLTVMAQTNDGFVLAEKDLEQRGPGEFLGTRQAGFSSLKMAALTDVRLIEKARTQAQSIFNTDPEFETPENQPLLKTLHRFWGETQGDIS
jgi:ATP-dependent DNA helicase RecG